MPSSFGSAYVGETFACSLCATNELEHDAERAVVSIKMEVEMQTPSTKIPLNLTPDVDDEKFTIKPGESVQKIVRFDLREEGTHVLGVSLSYSETTTFTDRSASSGRVRTFRKLYQFPAQPCLGVRTKITHLPAKSGQQEQAIDYALEAQLENLADGPLSLEKIDFNPRSESTFTVKSLNWDSGHEQDGQATEQSPYLSPRDVWQVALFLQGQHTPFPKDMLTKDGRTILGQLSLQWRTAMGNKGYLSTGWLLAKKP